MAVQWPNTRVILLELQDHEARFDGSGEVAGILKMMHVTSNSIPSVDDTAVPFAIAFSEHVEVMAVQVHRMASNETVVHKMNADILSARELIDIPFGFESRTALLDVQKNRRVIVATVSLVVEKPDKVGAI